MPPTSLATSFECPRTGGCEPVHVRPRTSRVLTIRHAGWFEVDDGRTPDVAPRPGGRHLGAGRRVPPRRTAPTAGRGHRRAAGRRAADAPPPPGVAAVSRLGDVRR